jgi:hypothetical protein
MRRIKAYYGVDETENGLYTFGDEYMTEDQQLYVGPYHRYTTTSEVFTESQWNIRQSRKLLPYVKMPATIKTYKSLKNLQIVRSSPSPIPPTITTKNIATGFMTRYFCSKRNAELVFDTDETQYQQWLSGGFDRIMWDIVVIDWKITGPYEDVIQNGVLVPGVISYNARQLQQVATIIPTIQKYVTRLTEYHTDVDFVTPKDINGLDS